MDKRTLIAKLANANELNDKFVFQAIQAIINRSGPFFISDAVCIAVETIRSSSSEISEETIRKWEGLLDEIMLDEVLEAIAHDALLHIKNAIAQKE